jgi:hypothetical protein
MRQQNSRTLTRNEIHEQGLVVIGEFGFGGVGDGGLIVAPTGETAAKVQAYYDSDDDGEDITDQLKKLQSLGGEFIREG